MNSILWSKDRVAQSKKKKTHKYAAYNFSFKNIPDWVVTG